MSEPGSKKPPLAKAIAEQCCDGQWWPAAFTAEKLGTTEQQLRNTLRRSKKLRVVIRPVGNTFDFRAAVHTPGMISLKEIMERLTPLIAKLKHEGGKRVEASAPIIVAGIAWELEQLMKEWSDK